MKFNLHTLMKSSPNFKIDTRLSPVNVEGRVSGSFKGSVSSISTHIDPIPIKVAIPFMKRKKRLTVVAMIGGFNIKLNPFTIKIEDASMQINGLLGTNGIEGSMDCQVACKTEMEMKGKVNGKIGTAVLDFCEDHDTPEHDICGNSETKR